MGSKEWDMTERLCAMIEGFPGGSGSKEPACNARDLGLIPESGRSPGEEWVPTPIFLPGESQGQRTWWATVHGVSKSWT